MPATTANTVAPKPIIFDFIVFAPFFVLKIKPQRASYTIFQKKFSYVYVYVYVKFLTFFEKFYLTTCFVKIIKVLHSKQFFFIMYDLICLVYV